MDEKKETWSKERILTEMKDIENTGGIYFVFSLSLLMPALGFIIAGVAGMPYFLVVGLAFIFGGIFLFKKYLQKNRQYNELKKKL